MSAIPSPWTIHFWIKDKSALLGPARGPLSATIIPIPPMTQYCAHFPWGHEGLWRWKRQVQDHRIGGWVRNRIQALALIMGGAGMLMWEEIQRRNLFPWRKEWLISKLGERIESVLLLILGSRYLQRERDGWKKGRKPMAYVGASQGWGLCRFHLLLALEEGWAHRRSSIKSGWMNTKGILATTEGWRKNTIGV